MAVPFVIAVRTYERPDLFGSLTLQTLKDQGLVDRLTVFVGSDITPYRERYPDLTLVSVPKGGNNAIAAICAYYPVGTPIVFMDDDLTDFRIYDLATDTLKTTGLADTIAEGFTHAPFSFGFLRNKFWLRKQPRFKPSYKTMAGCFFGAFNAPELIATSHAHMDDTLRTIQYMKTGIVPWSFPGASFKTSYGGTPGGLQSSGDRSDSKRVCEEIEPQVRGWCSGIVQQPCGLWAWKWLPVATIRRLVQSGSIGDGNPTPLTVP